MADKPARLPDVQRGREIRFTFDDEVITARQGESIAAALLAGGRRTIRRTARTGAPRGLFCAMGVCFDCSVTIAGGSAVRACLEPVAEGMIVTSEPG